MKLQMEDGEFKTEPLAEDASEALAHYLYETLTFDQIEGMKSILEQYGLHPHLVSFDGFSRAFEDCQE